MRCEAVEIETSFPSFEDYWRPLLGGTGPAPSYVTSLDEGRRNALELKLRETLRPEPGGAITLLARAWAVRGNARGA